jgi:nitrite reductase/ring-hydroxylating ferredoxin subunit
VTGVGPEKPAAPSADRAAADEPHWRRDFPVDWPQDQYVARREFTKFLVLTSFAFVVGQVWVLAKLWLDRRRRPGRVEIARASEIPPGGFRVFHYPGPTDPRILVRLPDGTFVAYAQGCTHLSCPVIPEVSKGLFHCPCHSGSFDLATGRVLAGPPRRPLPVVRLEIVGDHVFAVGVEGKTS